MGMSVRYNISINSELVDRLHEISRELRMPVSKFVRISVIKELRAHGKTVSDENTYWGARTDLPNRVKEADKRKMREERAAKLKKEKELRQSKRSRAA